MKKTLEKLEQNYISLNLELMKKIGIIPSIVFSLLIEKMKISKENLFHYSIDELMEKSTLSRTRQAKAIKMLHEMNLINIKKKGMPNRRFFSINFEELEKLLT